MRTSRNKYNEMLLNLKNYENNLNKIHNIDYKK